MSWFLVEMNGEHSLHWLELAARSQSPPLILFGGSWTHSSLSLDVTPPSPAERTIIDRYSHRIWELTLGRSDSDIISDRLLRLTSFEPSVLLPNLRALRWNYHTRISLRAEVPFMYIRRLLCPKLTSLDVIIPERETSLVSFFDAFSRLCPNLKFIKFDFDGDARQVCVAAAPVLARSICSYASLVCLELSSPIDAASLRHLASLSTLKTLSLILDPQIIQPHEICVPATKAPCCIVQELDFTIWDFQLVTCFLQILDQAFRTLKLYLHDQPTPRSVSAFFTRLIALKLPHTDTLRSFRFALHREPPSYSYVFPYLGKPEGPLNHCFSYDTFSPLESFTSLRELVIDMNHQTSLDDNELMNLARSWPLLEVLHLDCLPGEYRRPVAKSVTLNGLLSLLTSCLNLHELHLSLDAREVPVEAGAVIRNTAIRSLLLKNSLIDHPHLVEEFLFEHLPNVSWVETQFTRHLPRDSNYHAELLGHSWREVNSFRVQRVKRL
ncbi:hypothetical protein J3R83DRAFT_4895 [Lanmaoa asiatica]|nr:hypothetical protein J3R83DRAFT_4895 [Lanmaoa asiatica]